MKHIIKMKKVFIIVSFLTVYNIALFSQYNYFFKTDTPDFGDTLNCFVVGSNYIITFFNQKFYKINFQGEVVDSLSKTNTYYIGKIKSHDTIVFIGSSYYAPTNIHYIMLDSNLRTIKETNIFTPFYLNDGLMNFFFYDSYILIFDYYQNVYKISYDGQLLSYKTISNNNLANLVATKINEYYLYVLREYFNVPSSSYELSLFDTSLTLIKTTQFPLIFVHYFSSLNSNFNDSTFFIAGTYNSDCKLVKYKYNASYDLQIIKTEVFNGPLANEYPAMKSLDKIGRYIFFTYNTHSFQMEEMLVNSCFVVAMLDTSLNKKWVKTFGCNNPFQAWEIKAMPDSGCLIGGGIWNTSTKKMDIFFLRLDKDGNIVYYPIINIPINKIIISPNPGNNKIICSINGVNKGYCFELFNISGILVTKSMLVSNYSIIDTYDIPSGIYFYRITHNGQVISQGKWIKQ